MTDSVQLPSPALELALQLIRQPSITPDDHGCQSIIANRLRKLGFTIEELRFGAVSNLWARLGLTQPLFVFAGHTDVVPPGPSESWNQPPFAGMIENGNLYGRGAADMKSAIAAMIVATEDFLQKYPQPAGSIAFLITSDEEGEAVNGTAKVIEQLKARHEKIDFCLVGEPTSVDTLGDTIKNGRRGSLNGSLTIKGQQGHVAYPERADNPIHAFAPALAELCAQTWDNGNEYFSATTFQLSNLYAGTGAENVIPGELKALFNFRFSTCTTADELKKQVHNILDRYGLQYELAWRLSGQPFITSAGHLTASVSAAIEEITGIRTTLSTTGGTSDARFIAPTGAQVVEFGLINDTIHQANEHVKTADVCFLQQIYECLLEKLLLPED